jgi:hypothetical protein
VPKSQYDRIRAGWRACVTKTAHHIAAAKLIPTKAADAADASDSSATIGPPEPVAVPAALMTTGGLEDAGGSSGPIALQVVRTIGSVDLIMVWLGAALALPWFGWRIADRYLARRKIATVVMRHFAARFVFEFERPLVRHGVKEHALRSRLRFRARPGRFDILLAPGDGRRYPNLSDHKKNVEYDVARVLQVLGDASFKNGPLSVDAEWVVVPFQFKASSKQVGVTCISSF